MHGPLIEQAQERQAKQTVNAMLRSTIEKNKTIVATISLQTSQDLIHLFYGT
ncbi:MAG: hypothetical protein NT070_10815 [Cyanobacteria bacterium]|nr:hypothetical protein [Cyanobacteriota bacterium]